MQKKTVRKYKRGENTGRNTKKILDTLTLDEMFDKFMTFKKTEALAPRTIQEYYIHFNYLKEFLGDDMTNENVTLEDFRGYIGYMLHDKELSPMTVNIRIRTMRAFIRFCYTEGYIENPIHESFKPVKAPEDTLESFTPAEIKKLLANWSIFEYGSTIPLEFQEDFDIANGVHIERGERQEVQIIFKGRPYKASFVNVDRKVKSDTYQIRYDGNKELKNLLFEVFSFSYKYLNAARKQGKLEGKKKVFPIVPKEQAEFIDFVSTGKPFEYEIIFHPYFEENQSDEDYQEEIETTLKDKIAEYEDVPKNKPSKSNSNRNGVINGIEPSEET